MNKLYNPAPALEHAASATLYSPASSERSWNEVRDNAHLELGLISALGSGYIELRGVKGYSRQSADRSLWTVSGSGEMINRREVEFEVSMNEAKPLRVTLFADGKPVASGGFTDTHPGIATLGRTRLFFRYGCLRFMPWR